MHLVLRKFSDRVTEIGEVTVSWTCMSGGSLGMPTGETSWKAVIRKTKKDMGSNIYVRGTLNRIEGKIISDCELCCL
jgi:hypothetical protein